MNVCDWRDADTADTQWLYAREQDYWVRELAWDASTAWREIEQARVTWGLPGRIAFDNQKNEDDYVFEHMGIAVVTDDASLDLLNGSVIDFVEDLMGASFQIKNPNATASCGCGSSFAV